MSRRNNTRKARYWLNVRLDPDLDADLIQWLQDQPHGRRSELVRQALRAGLSQSEPRIDLDGFRSMVAEELNKALAGRPLPAVPEASPSDDLEARYGSRLDRMMGGLVQSRSAGDGEG